MRFLSKENSGGSLRDNPGWAESRAREDVSQEAGTRDQVLNWEGPGGEGARAGFRICSQDRLRTRREGRAD